MKIWIKTCNEQHGSPCVVRKEDATTWPSWLIDTASAWIVEGNMAHRYLALSYVWGGVQTLQLTTSDMDRLRRPGSLAKEEITLPKTIREALEITQLLEERYIFVDQLCIIQDDQQHRMAEIKHMGEIYANSYLTLAAVIGWTADAGLVDYFDQWIHQCPSSDGLERDVGERHLDDRRPIKSVDSRDGFYTSPPPHICLVISLAPCGDATEWRETSRTTTRPLNKSPTGLPYQRPGPITWPDFPRYFMQVFGYTPRHFTYDSDVVPAFAGTASSFAKIFPGGILYGLPVLFFDVALLWTFRGPPSRRRIDTTLHESMRPPSWSWMTWRGILEFPPWEDLFLRGRHGVVTSPLVQWYYIGPGGGRIRIESEHHKYRYFAQDAESTPPPGWSRITSSSSSPCMHQKHCYVTPYAPGQQFEFPIPLMDTSLAVTIPNPISNKIIGKSERAYFHVVRRKSDPKRGYPHILDANGSPSGTITGFEGGVGESEIDNRVELIAISTVRTRQISRSSEDFILGAFLEEHRECYNVLWVKWKGGVAYREALGIVSKKAWEAANRESIEVVLG